MVISEILVVYNAENGEVISRPTKAAKEPINCIAISRDGKTFATASYPFISIIEMIEHVLSGDSIWKQKRKLNLSSNSPKAIQF